jgi:hypothetical protein
MKHFPRALTAYAVLGAVNVPNGIGSADAMFARTPRVRERVEKKRMGAVQDSVNA